MCPINNVERYSYKISHVQRSLYVLFVYTLKLSVDHRKEILCIFWVEKDPLGFGLCYIKSNPILTLESSSIVLQALQVVHRLPSAKTVSRFQFVETFESQMVECRRLQVLTFVMDASTPFLIFL